MRSGVGTFWVGSRRWDLRCFDDAFMTRGFAPRFAAEASAVRVAAARLREAWRGDFFCARREIGAAPSRSTAPSKEGTAFTGWGCMVLLLSSNVSQFIAPAR